MATITRRGDSYRIRVSSGYSVEGKQIVHSMTWRPEPGMTLRQIEKAVSRAAIEFEERCKGGMIGGNVKFQTYAEKWLKEYAEPNLRTRTVDRYKQLAKRAYIAIGGLHLEKITPVVMQRFVDNLQETGIKRGGGKLSPKSVREHLSFVSTVLESAVRLNMIKDNPCRRVSLPTLQQKERDIYSLEETQRFLELLKKEPITYRVFFTLALFGGFRKGELLGLEWQDINFDSNIISVRRSSLYSPTRGGTFTDGVKTKESARSLKMPNSIFDLLREYRAWQDAERLRLGDRWQNTDRLFTGWDGRPMATSTPMHWLYAFFKRTGMRRITIHSFRHENASLLINSGADVKTVSSALGHSETSTTLNIYAHSFQEAQAKASQAVANVLNFKKKKAKIKVIPKIRLR